MTKMLRRRMLGTVPCRILGPVVKETERHWVVNGGCLDKHLDLHDVALWLPFKKPRISKYANNRSMRIYYGFHDEPCPLCPDYEEKANRGERGHERIEGAPSRDEKPLR